MAAMRMADIVEESDDAVFQDGFEAGFFAGHSAGGHSMMNFIMGWQNQGQPDAERDLDIYQNRRG